MRAETIVTRKVLVTTIVAEVVDLKKRSFDTINFELIGKVTEKRVKLAVGLRDLQLLSYTCKDEKVVKCSMSETHFYTLANKKEL